MAAKRAGGGKASSRKTKAGSAKPAQKSKPAKAAAKKAAPVKGAAKKTAPKAPAKKSKPAKAAATKATPPKAAPPKAATKTAASKKVAAKPADAKQAKPAKAEGANGGLKAGDAVPSIELVDHEGNPFALDSLHGESYVLYFYPKDDTPGCTKEACTFRDDLGKYDGAKVRVIGISPDKPESHVKFREKYGLPFTLLSDVEKTAANAFGVWVKKQNYGREYMGIERSTFLVDDTGTIKKVWRNVRVDGHSQAILDAAS
jgi:peroxiredoxin Q/BCP